MVVWALPLKLYSSAQNANFERLGQSVHSEVSGVLEIQMWLMTTLSLRKSIS